MSKLSNLIRRISRTEPAPLGFGSGPRKPSPTMLLVALVGERWSRSVADAAAAGADAFALTSKPSESDLTDAVSAAAGRPCGLISPQPGPDELDHARNAGLDFLVVAPEAPASILNDESSGVLLQIKDDLTDIQLRTIEALDLDAVYLERQAGPLTIRQQMELQRFAGLARKPLLLQVRPNAEQPDLLCLRDAGAPLVALDLKDREAIEALRRLRGVIDALPQRRRPRREERGDVILPRAAARQTADDDDDEGEGVAAIPDAPIRHR